VRQTDRRRTTISVIHRHNHTHGLMGRGKEGSGEADEKICVLRRDSKTVNVHVKQRSEMGIDHGGRLIVQFSRCRAHSSRPSCCLCLQLASVILKQYVETHWCSQSEKFRPPETTDQVNHSSS